MGMKNIELDVNLEYENKKNQEIRLNNNLVYLSPLNIFN
jgi:hypothetical protein